MGYGKEPGAYLAPDRIRDIIRYTVMYYLLKIETYRIHILKPIIKIRNYYAFENEPIKTLAFKSGEEYNVNCAFMGTEGLHDCTERIVSLLMYHMSIIFDSSRTFTECTVNCNIERDCAHNTLVVTIDLW